MRLPQFLRHRRLDPLRGRGSLRAQLVWLTATASTVAVVVLGTLVQLLVSSTTNGTIVQVLNDRAETVVSSVIQASSGQKIVVPQARLDADVAVYDDTGHVVAGAVPDALEDQYEKLRTSRSSIILRVGDYARVHALGFSTDAGVKGTVVVSERLAPYADTAQFALAVTLGAGLLLIAASTGLVAFASRRVLAPVAAMARTADEWSEHDLTRRFDLGRPDNEITALGHTLDGLLDKVSATIRSEQRLTSELAHELRTPLTAVQGNAELLLLNGSLDEEGRADLDDILAACRRMSATISGLIDLARSNSSVADASVSSVQDVVGEVMSELDLPDSAPGLRIETTLTSAESWTVPQQLAVRALTPVMSNAVKFAESLVRVTVDAQAPGVLSVLVEDDGPGVDPAVRNRIFRPGQTIGDGAGLGLALSRRIARMSGGDVSLDDERPMTTFRLTLPGTRHDGRTRPPAP